MPLVLALFVFFSYNIEGIRAHGFFGYIKSLVPRGVGGAMLLLLYPLEILSNFLRLLSLTIRLWANLLAGHLLIDFMAGALAVLLGLQVLGWFTLPDRGRDLPLRGFADRGPPGFHLRDPHRHLPRQRHVAALMRGRPKLRAGATPCRVCNTLLQSNQNRYRGSSRAKRAHNKEIDVMLTHLFASALNMLHPFVLATGNAEIAKEGLRSVALGVGAGGGAAGAGAGIGMLFGKVIEAVTRQPEMRDEITLDPVARLRADRGDVLLRPRRRLHCLLPLESA